MTNTEQLQAIKEEAQLKNLSFAGVISPQLAYELFEAQKALIIDVRTPEELAFVGYVSGVLNVPWATGTAFTKNPRFIRELEAKVAQAEWKKEDPILLLCRSGQRSALAASLATTKGFSQVFNIEGGFEGELNAQEQRGEHNGWRKNKLPWKQN